MICIIAFVVLSILGIFSATHRALAKEAFDCVLRRITLRPCTTGFNEKIKAQILGKVLIRSEIAARFLNKHFELFSWLLFFTMIASLFWTGKGLVNFYMYGSCNGLNKSGFCALDPKGENNKVSQAGGSCAAGEGDESKVTLEGVDLSLFPTQNTGSKDEVILIGCYSCDYTRKAYPLVKKLISENDVNYTFAHYPVKEETLYLLPIGYCAYKQDQNKFWQLNDKLFSSEKSDIARREFVDTLLKDIGYDLDAINSCSNSPETNTAVVERRIQLEKTNIYGTPLVFINDKGLVGPKPYRVYERILKGWRFW
jgi:predicted DsbA family dithiol-disulfide isomerase